MRERDRDREKERMCVYECEDRYQRVSDLNEYRGVCIGLHSLINRSCFDESIALRHRLLSSSCLDFFLICFNRTIYRYI